MSTMVIRPLATVCAVAAIAVAVPTASATESTIYPGVGIGKVKLGMTQKQVKRALGSWSYVNTREGSHLSVGWGFAEWTVDFVKGRVVQLSTTRHAQRTKSGIGTGSSWRALMRAYPGGRCTWNNSGNTSGPGPVEYLVQQRSGTQTIFFLAYPQGPADQPTATPAWKITEVSVRIPFKRLPEFGEDWQLHCKDGWRTSDAPI